MPLIARLVALEHHATHAARLKRQGKRFGARRHMVFGRDGQPCYDCNTPIERVDVASRRLYYCPRCQAG